MRLDLLRDCEPSMYGGHGPHTRGEEILKLLCSIYNNNPKGPHNGGRLPKIGLGLVLALSRTSYADFRCWVVYESS